jgi:hypothetical protein
LTSQCKTLYALTLEISKGVFDYVVEKSENQQEVDIGVWVDRVRVYNIRSCDAELYCLSGRK